MQIPLINEHLFCKYFVRLSVGNATKGFATYGCFLILVEDIFSFIFILLANYSITLNFFSVLGLLFLLFYDWAKNLKYAS